MTLNLHMIPFNEWIFFNSIKQINWLRKEITRLLSKGM